LIPSKDLENHQESYLILDILEEFYLKFKLKINSFWVLFFPEESFSYNSTAFEEIKKKKIVTKNLVKEKIPVLLLILFIKQIT